MIQRTLDDDGWARFIEIAWVVKHLDGFVSIRKTVNLDRVQLVEIAPDPFELEVESQR
jgi:hypothetical protein